MSLQKASIGLILGADRAGVFVRRITHDSPAHFSGRIAVGDYIEEIDSVHVQDLSSAQSLLSGSEDSLVSLRVRYGVMRKWDVQEVHLLRKVQLRTSEGSADVFGISASLCVVREGVRVDKVMPGGPAWLCGQVEEDFIIVAIDGNKVTGGYFHSDEIAAMIKGPEGTRVNLEGYSRVGEERSVGLVRMPPVNPRVIDKYRRQLNDKLEAAAYDQTRGQASEETTWGMQTPGALTPAYVSSTPKPVRASRLAESESLMGKELSSVLLSTEDPPKMGKLAKSLSDFENWLNEEESECASRFKSLQVKMETIAQQLENLGTLQRISQRHISRSINA